MPIYVLEKRPCDVCRLLDDDVELKECAFCGLCDSWICPGDQNRWDRRLRAFWKRRVEPTYKGLPDYDNIIAKAAEEERTQQTVLASKQASGD